MCLVANKLVPEVLTEDLTVYKVLNSDGYSSCQFYLYIPFVLQPTIESKVKKRSHYTVMPHDWSIYEHLTEEEVDVISEGYHFAFTEERLRNTAMDINRQICEFVIPAGSTVYRDESGLGVASQIMRKGVSDQISPPQEAE